MKAKTLWTLATAFFMAMSLASCGGDDNSNDPNDPGNPDNPSTGTEGLDKESQEIIEKYADYRLWIGHWQRMDKESDGWVFMSGGNAWRLYYDDTDGYTTWRYLPDTNTLVTTTGSWSWTIDYQEYEEWGGTTPSEHFYGYSRDWWSDPNDELLVGTWVNGETGAKLTFTASGRLSMEYGGNTYSGSSDISQDVPRSWEDSYKEEAVARNIDMRGESLAAYLFVTELDGYKLTVEDCELYMDEAPSHQVFEGTYIFSAYVE